MEASWFTQYKYDNLSKVQAFPDLQTFHLKILTDLNKTVSYYIIIFIIN